MLPRWRTVRRIWVTTGSIAGAIFFGWSLLAYRAQDVAIAALQSDARVTVTDESTYWRFRPPQPSAAGLIFFPGTPVNPAAYAPLVRAVAAAGYTVLLVRLPRRGVLGGADGPEVLGRARQAAADTREVSRWVVAGHSRGGLVASRLAHDTFPALAGLVLIGTSHPRDFSLAALRVPVTRVFGSRDTVADEWKLDRTRSNLPSTTRMIRIDGGNHSQFGYYGFQPGDWPATISRDAQQAITRQALIDALASAAR